MKKIFQFKHLKRAFQRREWPRSNQAKTGYIYMYGKMFDYILL